MTICNVGSHKLSSQHDYGSQDWKYFAPHLFIYGIDADADACEQANQELESRSINWTERHIPLALGEAIKESTLYVTKHPMCSSLYPPNELYISRFQRLIEHMSLEFSIGIDITTLDEFCQAEGINEIDFLEVDVQGADFDVLRGGAEVLKQSILAIQTEVEFVPLYINQPLFGEIDTYLRKEDFTLFDLAVGRRIRVRSPIFSDRRPGQIMWADALYFRDLIREDIVTHLKTPNRIFKLACIADALNFYDYALELLEYLTVNYGKNDNYNFANIIVEVLSQVPEVIEGGIESLPIFKSIQEYITS